MFHWFCGYQNMGGAVGLAQLVECLPSMHDSQGSTLSRPETVVAVYTFNPSTLEVVAPGHIKS